MVPNKKKNLTKAISELVNSNSAPSLLNTSALRAVGAGFGQNVLEGAAFEVAVAATLFNSPVLEAQDLGDLIANIAVGAGVFGLVGGVVDATLINSALKKAANAADIEARPWTSIAETSKGSSSYGTKERPAVQYRSLSEWNMAPTSHNLAESRSC